MSKIISRPLEPNDFDMLKRSLDADEYEHASPDQYAQKGSSSEVYEDDAGPICILRYTKTLRIVAVWCNNSDKLRNAKSAFKAFADTVSKAKANGYSDIIFNTESPTLAKFCVKLGFEKSDGQYVKYV